MLSNTDMHYSKSVMRAGTEQLKTVVTPGQRKHIRRVGISQSLR